MKSKAMKVRLLNQIFTLVLPLILFSLVLSGCNNSEKVAAVSEESAVSSSAQGELNSKVDAEPKTVNLNELPTLSEDIKGTVMANGNLSPHDQAIKINNRISRHQEY